MEKKKQLGASLPYNGTGVANRIRRCRSASEAVFGSCSSSQHTVLLLPGSRPEPKQMHTGKETARGHFAKKSSSKQSKSRLFSDPGGQQPSTRGSGQTEVRKGNMVCVWGGGWEEKYDCTPRCTITEAMLSALRTNISGQIFVNFPWKPNAGCKVLTARGKCLHKAVTRGSCQSCPV